MRFNPLSDKIYIWGMPASGKSTFGRQLSEKMNAPFTDLDEYIEDLEQRSIHEIFKVSGEEYFRKAEHDALKVLMNESSGIIATGGGTPCFFNNAQLMLESGMTIFLNTDLDQITRRVSRRSGRPLLDEIENVREELEKIRERRLPYYSLAHLHINKKPTDLLFQIDRFFAP